MAQRAEGFFWLAVYSPVLVFKGVHEIAALSLVTFAAKVNGEALLSTKNKQPAKNVTA